MNLSEKDIKIEELQAEISSFLYRKDEIEARCGQLVCEEYDDCSGCETGRELAYIEEMLLRLGEDLYNVEWDIDTWSYTIMGNGKAVDLHCDFIEIPFKYITEKEYEKYGENLPDEFLRDLIVRSYKELLEYAHKQNSRLAFQVLGVFLMENGGMMTKEVKELILENSKWEDEKDQLKDEQDKIERKKYLLDFREKIKNYTEGRVITVPFEPLHEIKKARGNDWKSIERQTIFEDIATKVYISKIKK